MLAMGFVAGSALSAELPAQNRGKQAEPRLLNPSTVLKTGRTSVSVGTEGAGPAMIGYPKASVLDARGNVYVLDDANFTVRAFDPHGKLISTVGRNGRGPGDLSQPYSIAHDGDSLLYLADQLTGLSVYSARNGQLRYLRTMLTSIGIKDVCVARGRLFVAMSRDDKVVHEISPQGEVLQSFAPIFGLDSNEVIREWSRTGSGIKMTCDSETGGVAVLYSDGNTRIYTLSGAMRWRGTLPGFQGSKITGDLRTRGTSMTFPKHALTSVLIAGPYVVVQAFEVVYGPRQRPLSGPRLQREVTAVLTWVLSKSNGAVLAHGKWGPALADVRGNVALAFEEDPFPRVWAMPLEANVR
jgi:hypothetical protein